MRESTKRQPVSSPPQSVKSTAAQKRLALLAHRRSTSTRYLIPRPAPLLGHAVCHGFREPVIYGRIIDPRAPFAYEGEAFRERALARPSWVDFFNNNTSLFIYRESLRKNGNVTTSLLSQTL